MKFNYTKLSKDLQNKISHENKIVDIAKETGICTAVISHLINNKRDNYTISTIIPILNYLNTKFEDYL